MKDLTSNPYGKFNGNEQKYVNQALDTDNYEGAPWSQRFEEEFCRKMNVKYAVSCNSGTSGLHAALYAAGVTSGDEVITPALTVVMDAYAAIHLGATPIFADIDPETLNIDPDSVAEKITPKTKAIITVSLEGLSADMDPIMEIARKNNIKVIEDSAQTFLGIYKGKIAGTIGDLGVFSFENKKHISCFTEGGMIVTDNPELAKRARKFAGIGYKHMSSQAGRTSLAISEVQDPHYERFDTLGLNYRMPEISAAVGLAQFERVDAIVNRRKSVAKLFDEAIEGCEWLVKQKVPDDYVNSFYTYAIKYYGDDKFGISWKDFYNQYISMGGDGFYGACKIPYQEPVFKDFEVNGSVISQAHCPVAEEIQPRIMQFKTNYRNLDEASIKAEVLSKLIDKIENNGKK